MLKPGLGRSPTLPEAGGHLRGASHKHRRRHAVLYSRGGEKDPLNAGKTLKANRKTTKEGGEKNIYSGIRHLSG